ncbi:hypothetical protein F7725_005810 [Dissostichus mawsoni]|uniref:Winged helix Storkhead-box1 domain-containing protein n=1 Tax=Dissostichus mawsoni TaxID=36200 RepID=A0A7J5YSM2_DISMA|nr:hypothetical protein F7725_005810 [Dissostichus mawsoni]
MKKNRSSNVRRAWPSSELSERPLEHNLSRSEKDIRVQKQHLPPPPAPHFSPSPPSYRAPGDVSPISMSPISQSQFIPLGEILCLAISAMNSAHKPVNQEALVEHLTASFPGVPTPSSEVLRHTLNMLNHNDSYNSYREDSSRLHSTKSPKEHRGDSHQSKPPKDHKSGETPPSTSAKEHRGEPPSYPHPPPPTSPPVVQPPPQEPADKSKSITSFPYKTDTLTKKKEGSGGSSSGEKQSKRFGLRLFRLSFKKDKMRQLATFSAQFPPEEWPLRDEEVPTTAMPREVEMEIIRRINPDLTVENVARHTAVMKRIEEERSQKNKAGSSAHHSARSRRGRGHRRATHGKSRSHSKPRTSRGDPSEGSNWDLLFMERDFRFFSHSLVRSPREAMYTLERRRSGGATYLVHSNPNVTESSCPVTLSGTCPGS